MELETVCRYKLPIVFVVVNNNGIAMGGSKDFWNMLDNTEAILTRYQTLGKYTVLYIYIVYSNQFFVNGPRLNKIYCKTEIVEEIKAVFASLKSSYRRSVN